MRQRSTKVWLAGLALAVVGTTAMAHSGHSHSSELLNSPLVFGLLHPLGLDHLLTCIAAGTWAAMFLAVKKQWLVPAIYCISLLTGGLVGLAAQGLFTIGHGVALSLVLLAGLIGAIVSLRASRRRISLVIGSLIIGASGLAHGIMHGFEFSGHGQLAYSVGFGLTSTALIVAGLSVAHVCRALYEQTNQRRLKCQQWHPTN